MGDLDRRSEQEPAVGGVYRFLWREPAVNADPGVVAGLGEAQEQAVDDRVMEPVAGLDEHRAQEVDRGPVVVLCGILEHIEVPVPAAEHHLALVGPDRGRPGGVRQRLGQERPGVGSPPAAALVVGDMGARPAGAAGEEQVRHLPLGVAAEQDVVVLDRVGVDAEDVGQRPVRELDRLIARDDEQAARAVREGHTLHHFQHRVGPADPLGPLRRHDAGNLEGRIAAPHEHGVVTPDHELAGRRLDHRPDGLADFGPVGVVPVGPADRVRRGVPVQGVVDLAQDDVLGVVVGPAQGDAVEEHAGHGCRALARRPLAVGVLSRQIPRGRRPGDHGVRAGVDDLGEPSVARVDLLVLHDRPDIRVGSKGRGRERAERSVLVGVDAAVADDHEHGLGGRSAGLEPADSRASHAGAVVVPDEPVMLLPLPGAARVGPRHRGRRRPVEECLDDRAATADLEGVGLAGGQPVRRGRMGGAGHSERPRPDGDVGADDTDPDAGPAIRRGEQDSLDRRCRVEQLEPDRRRRRELGVCHHQLGAGSGLGPGL